MNYKHEQIILRARAQAKKLITSAQGSGHEGYMSAPSIFIGQPQDTDSNQSEPGATEAEIKHLESIRRYPHLGLSKDEYVILDAQRHPIGLVSIWLTVVLVILMTFVALPIYDAYRDSVAEDVGSVGAFLPSSLIVAVFLLVASALFVLGGLLASKVYLGNKFYLTNESIIQRIQKSLFNVKDQVINLVNVEDVSYDKRGILQHALDYGNLRLSTQGEETTYHFYTVGDPAKLARAVNDATEKAMRELENPSGSSK